MGEDVVEKKECKRRGFNRTGERNEEKERDEVTVILEIR